MEPKKLKSMFALGVIGTVLAVILISGCVENENKGTINETIDYKSIAKDNINAEYKWKILELKAATIKASGENDELIKNETEKFLKKFTKEDLLKDANEYGLSKEEISYIKSLNEEEFEVFKNETIKPYAVEEVKNNIIAAAKEVTEEYNFTILEIISLNEIKDINTYLDFHSIAEEVKADAKKKVNDGKYIAIIEMDVATKFNVVEICDERGNIIKNVKNMKH